MSEKTVVVIIEDDVLILNFLTSAVQSQGYKTIQAQTGAEGISLAASWNPDVILLDLGLPDMEGQEVITRLRELTTAAIIVVTARHVDHEKVEALDRGADDYIPKPFSVPELLARIRVALRHRQVSQSVQAGKPAGSYQNRDISIDYAARRVTMRGKTVHLTPIEYAILSLLAVNAGKVLTHKQILDHIYGSGYQSESDYQALRVFVSNLRHKLEENPADPGYIETEVGIGYRLATTSGKE